MQMEIPLKSVYRYREGQLGLQSAAYKNWHPGTNLDGITRMYQVGDNPDDILVQDYAFSANPDVHRWLPVHDLYHGRTPEDLERGRFGIWRDRPQPMADEKWYTSVLRFLRFPVKMQPADGVVQDREVTPFTAKPQFEGFGLGGVWKTTHLVVPSRRYDTWPADSARLVVDMEPTPVEPFF